ncbi:hypothetical protein V2I01_34680 [Micromonospora sp. BRA006-A]|nr:hypothetical protein [Micromonospora sp. BRA006-A]
MRFRTVLTRAAAAGAAALLAVTALTACGNDDTAAADNPYGLLQPGVIRAGTPTDAPPNVFLSDGSSPASTTSCCVPWPTRSA